ncbi:flagellar biosynthesis anti-sigma factor FlgM [Halomonas mongoliensis]|uniref:flagellar biosynthesis anti-sigma factor FlgM n=1 Tax=Halomonas mongoliensis TaxID=321265 RepID=UPI00403A8550
MKIDNHNPLIRTGQTLGRDEPQKVKDAGQQPAASDTSPSARTHLSHDAANTSQDIDTARVDEIREAIREGRLEIHAERIADGLIENVKELLRDPEA